MKCHLYRNHFVSTACSSGPQVVSRQLQTSLRSETFCLNYLDIFYKAQFKTVAQSSLGSLSWILWGTCCLCSLLSSLSHFFQYNRAEETTGTPGTIVSLGSYNTDWNLTFWRQGDPDVLNNKIPQTDNERQLWKRQRWALEVLTTVLQEERGKYQCSCVKHFCCLLWGNTSHSSHWHLRHKLKSGQDDPEFGDPIT